LIFFKGGFWILILDFDLGIPTFAWIVCWIEDRWKVTSGGRRRRGD
jgi:hypothetical protein